MPIQVRDAQGNVVHTINAEQNPQARQQAQMMADSMGGTQWVELSLSCPTRVALRVALRWVE